MIFIPILLFSAQFALAQYNGGSRHDAPKLIDDYVCSIEGSYDLFGIRDYRSQFPHHPRVNWCQDTIGDKSCKKCCQIAARIQGTSISEDQIHGFNVILKAKPFCVCCAPAGTRNMSDADSNNSGSY